MCRKLLVVVLVGLLFSSSPANAAQFWNQAALDGSDELALNSGYDASGWFLPAGTSDGQDHWWSGTLIDPWHALTVAHGFTTGVSWTSLQFGLSPNFNDPDPATTRTVVNVQIHPNYLAGAREIGNSDDIAVVTFNEPIFSVAPAIRRTDPTLDYVGEHVWMIDHGQEGTYDGGLLPGDGQERMGEQIVDYLGWSSASIGENYMVAKFSPKWFIPSLPYEVMGSPGSSGGGWYDGMELVAMSCFTKTGSTGGLRVSDYDAYIRQATSDVPEPGTLVLLASALGGGGTFAFFGRRRKSQVKK